MATKSSSRPFWQHPLLLPAVLAVVAVVFLISGDGAFAFAFLLFAIGLLLYLMGKARRWKGAPGAGLLVVAIGMVTALWTLFSRV